MDSSTPSTPPASSPSSSKAPDKPGDRPPRTAGELLRLSQVDLYAVFRRSSAGDVPTGRGRGAPIVFPGTPVTRPTAAVFGTVVWRGKVFRPETDDLANLLSVVGLPAIRARVRREESWFDGQECIVLDYSETSRLFGWVRDEIREVRPGLYLGLVYGVGSLFGGRRLLDVMFTLRFSPADRAGEAPSTA